MNIHAAAHYLKLGYRITRPGLYVNCDQNWLDTNTIVFWALHLEDLLANDWEIDYRELLDNIGIKPVYLEPRNEEEESD
jgi:hypothetical protein